MMFFRLVSSRLSPVVVAIALGVSGLVASAVTSSAPVAAAAAPAGAGRFVQVAPTRIVDTRGTSPIVPDGTLITQVTGTIVPAGALAVAINVTIDRATKPGYVSLFPTGATATVSNLNVESAGQTVANMAIVALPASGKLTAFVNSGGYLLMDVAGYWLPATTATSGRFSPTTPVRVLDTRSGSKPAPRATVNATVAGGSSGVPADASAVAVTITAADATGAGFITAWAAGQPRPDASNVNLPGAGAIVPNLAIVPVGAGGQISLFTDAGTHLLVDVAGWFSGSSAASSDEGLFVPVSPKRLVDSRVGLGMKKLPGGLPVEMPIAIPDGLPSGASVSAVALNLTVTNTFDDGYLTASPSQVPVPNASNLNYSQGQTVAGLSITRVGANRNLNVFAFGGTDLIADIAGWFTGTPAADSGYRPPKCENLMAYTHEVGGVRSIHVKDRTNPASDQAISKPGVLVDFAEMAPRCEYVLFFTQNADGTVKVTRSDVFGTQSVRPVASSLDFGSFVISADANSLLFASGAPANGFDRYINRLDVRLGNSVVLSDVGSNIVVAVADVSSNGNFLDVLIVNDLSTGRVGLYRYDLRFLSRFQIVSGPRIVEMKKSPNGQNSASVLVSQAGVPTLLVAPSDTISTTSVTRANSYAVTWTPQGELVEANFTDDSVRISSAPFNAPTSLLDGTIDYSPSFPTFALV
jgi:hypothetical protein